MQHYRVTYWVGTKNLPSNWHLDKQIVASRERMFHWEAKNDNEAKDKALAIFLNISDGVLWERWTMDSNGNWNWEKVLAKN